MTGPVANLTIERFESLLDAYGGDLARWPAPLAAAAAALVGQSSEARARLAEAVALDRLLAKTSAPGPDRLSQLADRIVARAAAEGPPRASSAAVPRPVEGARIISLPRQLAKSGLPRRTEAVRTSMARSSAPPWRSVAALAASLLLGVAIGLTDIAQTTTLGIASLTEAAVSEAEVVISAVQVDGFNSLDEDQI